MIFRSNVPFQELSLQELDNLKNAWSNYLSLLDESLSKNNIGLYPADEEFDEMFKEADIDRDDQVNFEEAMNSEFERGWKN